MVLSAGNNRRAQQSTYAQSTYYIDAGDSAQLHLTFDYMQIEKIEIVATGELVFKTKVQIDGQQTTVLAVGLMLRYNRDQNNFSISNNEVSQIAVTLGYGVGDIEDNRFFQNQGFSLATTWAHNSTARIHGSAGPNTVQHRTAKSTATFIGILEIILLAVGNKPFIITQISMQEDGGLYRGSVEVVSGSPFLQPQDIILRCEAGAHAELPAPIYVSNENADKHIGVVFKNGGQGTVSVTYEVAPDAQGAK